MDLMNVFFTDGACQVWCELDFGLEDLDFYTLCVIPDDHWLSEELYMAGWDGIIDPEHKTAESSQGWCFAQSWVNWALKQGLAPGQPFLLKLYPPRYIQYGGYMEPVEYDVEFDWEIITAIPVTDSEALAAWEGWQAGWQAYTAAAEKAMAELNHKRETDIEAMYIKYDWYWPGQYDEMTPPTGLTLELCSRHTDVEGFPKRAWPELLQVRRDDGDTKKAMEELRALALEHLPALILEAFDKITIRRH